MGDCIFEFILPYYYIRLFYPKNQSLKVVFEHPESESLFCVTRLSHYPVIHSVFLKYLIVYHPACQIIHFHFEDLFSLWLFTVQQEEADNFAF